MSRALPSALLAGIAVLAVVVCGCDEITKNHAVGASCTEDSDCGTGNICSVTSDGTPVCAPDTVCDPTTFGVSCGGTSFVRCDPVEKLVVIEDCADSPGRKAPDATCGVLDCVGDCSSLARGCASPAGEACRSPSVEIFGDGIFISCGAGFGCELQNNSGDVSESCTPSSTCVVGNPAGHCEGNLAVSCYSANDGAGAFASPDVIDCASFGGTCVAPTDDTHFARCSVSLGNFCDDNFLQCSSGVCVGFNAKNGNLGTCG